ncbi:MULTISPECIES: HAMP domain-containing sensor histidine kinase [unclassified Dehalobacter]|jgi:Signal transduction histidine kinase|uniref:sensor histidine kinase n=1 Tax=unclassified Dehalobacter TaxID=2635733 RepID=UPI000552B5C1|nr:MULTISPECIES: HAMP domain-containing sensor histidine kinase [unclassified Dehalobacter]
MKSSIKLKLFTAISCLTVLYVLLSWFLNDQFLAKYYYLNKESTLKEYYHEINENYDGEPFDILLNLEKIERTEGLNITILDSSMYIKYISSLKEEGFFHEPLKKPGGSDYSFIPDISILKDAQNSTQPVIVKSTDRRLNSDFINLVGQLNNGDYLYLNTPVVAIEESAAIANKFSLITGLFIMVIGVLIVFFFTDRFTKPILRLNEIAQAMVKLDFGKKYPVRTYDEIGELGSSINSLSTQLEKSINELRQANEKLMEDIERERKIDDMRKEFISNVSHELKTPIALIRGYAEGLKVNVNESEEDKDFYCNVIIDESAKMNKLVKQLLELSQIDAGYTRLEKTDFDLNELVEFVLRKNILLIKEKNIQLTQEIQDKFTVNADIDRIEQIIVNYLVNAINHADQRKEIKVKLEKTGQKARVSVFNSGTPIPEEALDKIWTSFYKVDKARTRSYGGTGLGLSIVRATQEQHGNAYGVQNVENGVEFWFEVDLAE